MEKYVSFSEKLKIEMKNGNCNLNGYQNIKKTCEYLLSVIEEKKYYSRSDKMQFSVNVKLYKNFHYADIDDAKNVIIDILKNQYNVNKDYEKVIELLNISDNEISNKWYLFIEDNQRYIKDYINGYCTDDKKEKEILNSIDQKSVGFYGRQAGHFSFNSDIDYESELSTIIYDIENNYIKEEYDYNRLQSDIREFFINIVSYCIILDDIKYIVDNTSFIEELKYNYENEISENEEIQTVIINVCKQLKLIGD